MHVMVVLLRRPWRKRGALCRFDSWVLTLLDNTRRVEPALGPSSNGTRSAQSCSSTASSHHRPRTESKAPSRGPCGGFSSAQLRTRVAIDENIHLLMNISALPAAFSARPRYFTDPNLHSAPEGSSITHLGPVQFDQPCKIWHSSKCTNTSLSLSQPGAKGVQAS